MYVKTFENSSTKKVGKQVPLVFSMSSILSFKSIEKSVIL